MTQEDVLACTTITLAEKCSRKHIISLLSCAGVHVHSLWAHHLLVRDGAKVAEHGGPPLESRLSRFLQSRAPHSI